MADSYDVAVVGAGVFGAWTAFHLRRSGRSVALLDAYGAANGRASSAGESRVLRMGYGAIEIYTRWAQRSREMWIDVFDHLNQPELFIPTGLLWTAPPEDANALASRATLADCGIPFEPLDTARLAARFPQFRFPHGQIGTLEPDAGVILARRAVRAIVEAAVRDGVDYFREAALAPDGAHVRTASGMDISAGAYVYACGPWLSKLFPQLLTGRIRSTRQEVFFFGCPPGDRKFTFPEMPVWLDFSDPRGPYSFPDLENRGFKIGFDRHGAPFDPDAGDRITAGLEEIRAFVAERFPALAGAPLIDSRVCQYENTSNGDFLIDRHPDFDNVWLVGGGSGHGFKHGPMVGRYTSSLIEGSIAPEPRFSLSTKMLEEQRSVY